MRRPARCGPVDSSGRHGGEDFTPAPSSSPVVVESRIRRWPSQGQQFDVSRRAFGVQQVDALDRQADAGAARRVPAATVRACTSGMCFEAHQVFAQHVCGRLSLAPSCAASAGTSSAPCRAGIRHRRRRSARNRAARRAGRPTWAVKGGVLAAQVGDQLPLVEQVDDSGAAAKTTRHSNRRRALRAAAGDRGHAHLAGASGRGTAPGIAASRSSAPQVAVGDDHQFGDQLVERDCRAGARRCRPAPARLRRAASQSTLKL